MPLRWTADFSRVEAVALLPPPKVIGAPNENRPAAGLVELSFG